MLIYIVVFCLSSFFAYLASKFENKKILTVIFSIIAILIPSYLAGVRDLNIGTDVAVYGKPFFNRAVESSSFDRYSKICKTDLGYRIVNYVVSRFTNNINIFLFVIEFLIIGIVYVAFYQRRKEFPIWLCMLCYFFLFYNRFLNLLRQGLAVSIVIYSYKYLEKDDLKKYFIGVIIASFFHPTAIFAATLYLIKLLLKSKSKNVLIPIISMVMLALILGYGKILSFLINNLGIVSDRYIIYLPSRAFIFNFVETILLSSFVILALLFSKKMNKINSNNTLYLLIGFFGIILTQLSGVADYADRIAFYYTGIFPIMLSTVPRYVGKNKIDKNVLTYIIIFLFFLFWYWKFIKMGSCETYPYTSNILGIF